MIEVHTFTFGKAYFFHKFSLGNDLVPQKVILRWLI